MDNITTVINDYTNQINSIKNVFLTDIATVVRNWEQIYNDVSNHNEQYFHKIIHNNVFLNVADKHFAALNPSEWVKWYKEYLDKCCLSIDLAKWEQWHVGFLDKYVSSINLAEWTKWHQEFLIDEKKHKEDGHNFNIFYLFRNELGIHVQETMHSRLLKFLLDSHASHGQGNKFLHKFLKLIGIESSETDIWHVTAEQGRIDILLYRSEPESVIIIENKSNEADDQPNQLYRYWYNHIYRKTKRKDNDFYLENKYRYQILYLTPDSNKHLSDQSISKPEYKEYDNLPLKVPMEIQKFYFNEHIVKWLDDCIGCLPDKNHRVKEYIIQYKMLCKTLKN